MDWRLIVYPLDLTYVQLHGRNLRHRHVPVGGAAVVARVEAPHARYLDQEHGGPQHMARAVWCDL